MEVDRVPGVERKAVSEGDRSDEKIHRPASRLASRGSHCGKHRSEGSSGVGVDSDGRLYTLIPGDCIAPSVAIRLDATFNLDRAIDVGVCPIAVTFTRVEDQ